MSSSLYNIDKLDDSNYFTWRMQMRSVLLHSEMWKCIEKDKDDVPDTKLDLKALATISLSIKPSQLMHISSCNKIHVLTAAVQLYLIPVWML